MKITVFEIFNQPSPPCGHPAPGGESAAFIARNDFLLKSGTGSIEIT